MRIALLLLVLLSACVWKGVEVEKLIIKSVFDDGDRIPDKYTCRGSNVSPPLVIDGLSERAKSVAIIMDDPDAPGGTFVHWVIWDIPPRSDIPEGVPKGARISSPFNASQGETDFGLPGYGGPCPPPGKPHRYYFKVYSLDTRQVLSGGTKGQLEAAMAGHILQKGQLVGIYSR